MQAALHPSTSCAPSQLYVIYIRSHTISIQESDHVQTVVAGPSLCSSLSSHAANMWNVDAHTIRADLPKVDNKSVSGVTFPVDGCVLSIKLKFCDCVITKNFMPSFLYSRCKMYSELINQYK